MEKAWWKESVVYQIYPRSFNDSNGDGIGDIKGIIEKLDYVKSLGIDVIWLSPVYKSPNTDNGYDVSDYRDIHPDFGDMADFKELLSEIHARGLKLVMDLVVNHSSDEHAWFVESRSSIDNTKRDYYIWRDGKGSQPPNNWESFFGGDAWTLDPLTNQYYLHLFTKKQPDLNWDNPKVRNEIFGMMRFWLEMGIDGFRMDVISLISKRNYEDYSTEDFNEAIATTYANGPKIHDYLKEMNKEVISNYDMMTVGEGPGITIDNGLDYVGTDRNELNMIFHFDHMFLDHGPGGKFDPKPYDFIKFKRIFRDWDEKLDDQGWNSIFLGNHDFPRMVSRFADEEDYWEESAKLLALMLLTMRGTPYIYQGDEIGMTNVYYEDLNDFRDIETLNVIAATSEDQQPALLKIIHSQGRDNARTPMHWNKSENAGFSTVEPWIKVNPNYENINVEAQERNPRSILHFYRKMVTIRQKYPALVYGSFKCFALEDPNVFAYYRQDHEYKLLIVLNFSEEEKQFELDEAIAPERLIRIVSNYRETSDTEKAGIVNLKPWESILYKIKLN